MAIRSAESEIRLSFSSTIKNTLDDGQVASVTVGETILSGKIQSGVEANQANRVWEDQDRTLTSGNTADVDVYDFAGEDIGAGDGNDGLGLALIMEEIVTFIVKHVSGAGRLEIMPTNPTNHLTWMPSMTVANGGALKAGGCLMLHQQTADAFNVTDASSHVVRFGANGGDVTYSLYILGRHDDEASSSSSSSSSTSTTMSSSSSTSSSESSSSSSSTSSSSCST